MNDHAIAGEATIEDAESVATGCQLAASRRNGLHSTGPRSAAGKARSRWNALRHGILSRETIITGGEGKEDPGEFRRLLHRFWEDLAPADVLEEVLVERIAASYWRLGRVQRAEVGAIRSRLDNSTLDREQADLERAEELAHDDVETTAARWRDLAGVDSLLNAVTTARGEVEAKGFLDADEMDAFAEVVGSYDLLKKSPDTASRKLREERKGGALELLGGLEAEFQARRSVLIEKARLESEHQRMMMAVPDEATANRLQRYEAHLERQFYRALHELERLQRMRSGEAVPPSLHVQLESSD